MGVILACLFVRCGILVNTENPQKPVLFQFALFSYRPYLYSSYLLTVLLKFNEGSLVYIQSIKVHSIVLNSLSWELMSIPVQKITFLYKAVV